MNVFPPARLPAESSGDAPGSPRARLRKRWVGLALLLLGSAVAVDGFLIEPSWIEVTRHTVQAPFAGPLKIAHLSDLHTYEVSRRERRLLALLEAEKPDLIVVTGDTLARSGSHEACRQLLSRLHAPLGVWLVRGNWENWRPVKGEHAFYASAGVHFLLNEARPVRRDVWIVGLDDPSTGSPNLGALKDVPPSAFVIALFHSPSYFDQVAGRCPLALAGHTHGGQVRVPFLRPLWLPRGSGRFLAGWYDMSGSRMYVSRGVGTSVLPVRFRCRPELAILTVGG